MRAQIAAAALLLALPGPAGANTRFEPETRSFTCTFTQSCTTPEPYEDGAFCRDEMLRLSIIGGDGETLIYTPNADGLAGSFHRYFIHATPKYSAFVSSDGGGSNLVTIFPDMSVVWTGHFTQAAHLAYSHFGSCEEKQ
ncbi:hypothetical protein AIOL_002176 [Candidatus Rhodobacter oscarellae]|uniref:Uncharacterized protein n=1 Tax=Candidatus Rhodobacter oscarellae TaxID=1675527 RepID=A0A0J9E376_9RHOB|nr:hypothetical protein [Candidatus Rhodobacter lobularis]KMW57215.1 hypothetical protein AIOL_002176 [Candidatus Rhodobacter lobularis]